MIIFIHGADGYSSFQYLKRIKEKFIKEVDQSQLNIKILQGNKTTPEYLEQEYFASPFIATKRLIIAKNILTDSKLDFFDTIKKINDKDKNDSNILIIFENEITKKNTKVFKLLKTVSNFNEFNLANYQGIANFIQTEVKNKGGVISLENCNYLTSILPNDLWLISNEIDKLLGFCSYKEITREHINEIVTQKFDDDIFKLIDSIAIKNKPEAIRLIDDQFACGVNEMYILSMLIRQFKLMLQIKSMDITVQNNPDQIANILGVHPYVAKKTSSQARNFEMNYLKSIFKYLQSLDKSFKNSFADPKVLINSFIAKI